MDSALSPRDIQARIRAGESVEDVARAAGVSAERIDAFAAPVLAERLHVASLALANPVRRRTENTSNRPLRTATTEQLVARGIDPDDVEWDASLLGARRWQVIATYTRNDTVRDAMFIYDLNGRFSIAANDEARTIIGEALRPPASAPEVAAEFELEPMPEPQPDPEPEPAPAASEIVEPPARAVVVEDDADDAMALVRATRDEPDDEADVDDAYHETQLAEVDGVYDIVAGDDPEMDALYDMLASFDEDSVKIYAGLVNPDPAQTPVLADPSSAPSAETPPLPEGARVEPLYVPEDVLARRAATDATPVLPESADEAPAAVQTGEAVEAVESVQVVETVVEETVIVTRTPQPPARMGATKAPAATASVPIAEPEQPTLDEVDATAPRPAAKRKPKRAVVPSWDEIMFGAPRQGDHKAT